METISLVKSFGALGLVIGLIAVAALLARHFGLGGSGGFRRRDEKRLGVVEALTLDARRRVLLIRCDASEHLVLLGTNTEVVLTPAKNEAPVRSGGITPTASAAPATETHAPGPNFRMNAPRTPYRRDEPTLGPFPPRGR